MVMLAKAIALEDSIQDHKIVLVTDRIDLDDQIYGTFKHCGVEPEQATTGANLVDLLRTKRQRVVTTVINKFEAAVGKSGVTNIDPNIFVLVDEGHRTQFGSLHAKMRKVLPNACFIAFTGTPVMKQDRSTVQRFGGLIRPPYTIRDAVEDEAVTYQIAVWQPLNVVGSAFANIHLLLAKIKKQLDPNNVANPTRLIDMKTMEEEA